MRSPCAVRAERVKLLGCDRLVTRDAQPHSAAEAAAVALSGKSPVRHRYRQLPSDAVVREALRATHLGDRRLSVHRPAYRAPTSPTARHAATARRPLPLARGGPHRHARPASPTTARTDPPSARRRTCLRTWPKRCWPKSAPRDITGKARRRVAAELISDLERIYARKKAANKEQSELLPSATGTTLTELNGIGPAGAARLPVDTRRPAPTVVRPIERTKREISR